MLTGQQIAAARKSKGMTQTELANAHGVSTEAVSKWEKDAQLDECHTAGIAVSTFLKHQGGENVFDIPLIDWNGNGQIDYSDVAQTIAMNDSNDSDDEEDE